MGEQVHLRLSASEPVAAGDLAPVQRGGAGAGVGGPGGPTGTGGASGLDSAAADAAAGGGGDGPLAGAPDHLPPEQYISLAHEFKPPLEPYQQGMGIAVMIGARCPWRSTTPPRHHCHPAFLMLCSVLCCGSCAILFVGWDLPGFRVRSGCAAPVSMARWQSCLRVGLPPASRIRRGAMPVLPRQYSMTVHARVQAIQ